MTGTITLENIRNIRHLEFKIPDRGVWLLTAENGGGKSSLLACIRRIGYAQAFPVHFPTSQRSARLDNFDNASVKYAINNESVEYSYSGARWVPRPKRNSRIFEQFGYASVVYIGATAERITPKPGDFDPARVMAAPRYIIDNANEIFSTNKYGRLRKVNLIRGGRKRAFVMAHDDTPRTYHSENHFSMGELCVLNLLEIIGECPNNSLLLIDELELAIHPRAQKNLFAYLKRESERKGLTVIFSTHSVTLLKIVNRKNVILLTNSDGVAQTVVGCFPTFAIGFIADEEERIADSFIYVEDEHAALAIEPFIKLFISNQYPDTEVFPTVSVLPIGSFNSVLKFLQNTASAVPPHVKQHALLDEDVEAETLAEWQAEGDAVRLAEFANVRNRTSFLPWVPEVFACTQLRNYRDQIQARLRTEFMTAQIGININRFSFLDDLTGQPLRSRAKVEFKEFVLDVARSTGKERGLVKATIFNEIAKVEYQHDPGTYNALIGPLI